MSWVSDRLKGTSPAWAAGPGAGITGQSIDVGKAWDDFTGRSEARRAREEARRAREAEEARQEAIEAAIGNINDVFGQYNQNFYDKQREDYLNYYKPRLQDQFQDARRKTIFNLAGGPGLSSSAGIRRMGDLSESLQEARQNIGDRAEDFVNNMRGNVAKTKSSLIQQAQGGAGLDSIGNLAVEQANMASRAPAYNPLGDAFQQFTNTLAMDAQARRRGKRGFGGGGYGNQYGGGGSSSIIS